MNAELQIKPQKVYDIKERTFQFSIDIIHLAQQFPKNTAGFEIGKQLIRSGTSIGANIEEGNGARTKRDFVHCINVSKKEARETNYWLRLIHAIELINQEKIEPPIKESSEIVNILTTIVKNSEKFHNS